MKKKIFKMSSYCLNLTRFSACGGSYELVIILTDQIFYEWTVESQKPQPQSKRYRQDGVLEFTLGPNSTHL